MFSSMVGESAIQRLIVIFGDTDLQLRDFVEVVLFGGEVEAGHGGLARIERWRWSASSPGLPICVIGKELLLSSAL